METGAGEEEAGKESILTAVRLPRLVNRHIQHLKVWKERRKFQRTLEWLDDQFDKELSGVQDYEEQQAIEHRRQFECSEYDDKIQRIDSLELTSRARNCHIDVSDIGPPSEGEPSHWTQGNHGTWFLHPRSFRALAKAVEEAEYQRAKRKLELKDFWWKLITAIAAIVGAGAGIWNLLRKP